MKSLSEIEQIREETRENMMPRLGVHTCIHVVVFMGTDGLTNGSRETMLAFMDSIHEHHLTNVVIIQRSTVPFGAPVVDVVTPSSDGRGVYEKITYKHLTADKVERVVREHLIEGNPVKEYLAD